MRGKKEQKKHKYRKREVEEHVRESTPSFVGLELSPACFQIAEVFEGTASPPHPPADADKS